MSTFLSLMLLLLAATTSPALENNFSDDTDVPHALGMYTQNTLHELSLVSGLRGTKYQYCKYWNRYW